MKNLLYSAKLIIWQICFLALSFAFSSCSNDDEAEIPTLSYFKGTINGKYINIEQKSLQDLTINHDFSISLEDSIASYGFGIYIPQGSVDSRKMSINILLSPLSCKLYEIGPTYDLSRPDTRITLYPGGATSAEGDPKYRPTKTPFKIEIDTMITHKDNPDILWSSPRISGRMEGILYNIHNPQDSIVFKDVKFRVWNNNV